MKRMTALDVHVFYQFAKKFEEFVLDSNWHNACFGLIAKTQSFEILLYVTRSEKTDHS